MRRFTPDFKANAVRLVLDEGRTIDQVVEDLGLTRSSFCLWLRQARIDRGQSKGGELTSGERLAQGQRAVPGGPGLACRLLLLAVEAAIGAPN